MILTTKTVRKLNLYIGNKVLMLPDLNLIDDKINLNFPQTNNYLIIDFSFLSLF
jgi:hypothetical protein